MRYALAALIAAALVLPAHAQDKNRAFYKVEFNIRDAAGGAPVANRRFVVFVDSEGRGTLRVGNRVPVAMGGSQPVQSGQGQPLYSQFQYLDTGINIDCRVREAGTKASLSADIELSTLAPPDKSAGTPVPNPTLASVRTSTSSIVEPGKTVLLALIDDPVSQRKLNIEAIVTRID